MKIVFDKKGDAYFATTQQREDRKENVDRTITEWEKLVENFIEAQFIEAQRVEKQERPKGIENFKVDLSPYFNATGRIADGAQQIIEKMTTKKRDARKVGVLWEESLNDKRQQYIDSQEDLAHEIVNFVMDTILSQIEEWDGSDDTFETRIELNSLELGFDEDTIDRVVEILKDEHLVKVEVERFDRNHPLSDEPSNVDYIIVYSQSFDVY